MTRLGALGKGFGCEEPEQHKRRLRPTQTKVHTIEVIAVSRVASAQTEARLKVMQTEAIQFSIQRALT